MADEKIDPGHAPATLEPKEGGDRPIPPDVEQRHAAWRRLWTRAAAVHYGAGIASVAASSVAAVFGGLTGQIFAASAAVLTATIAFLKPERNYVKFAKAWRHLDAAVMQYRAGFIDRRALIDAVSEGEALLTRIEEEAAADPKPKTSDPDAPAPAETEVRPGAIP
jgi:hypothetical protein